MQMSVADVAILMMPPESRREFAAEPLPFSVIPPEHAFPSPARRMMGLYSKSLPVPFRNPRAADVAAIVSSARRIPFRNAAAH